MLVTADSAVTRPSGGSDAVLSRFHRLTPREARLLILSVDHDYSYAELAQALGVSHGIVANSLARVRRKLGVARGQKLTEFVANAPELAKQLLPVRAAEAVDGPEVSRRRKDVLRVTIAELERVSTLARRRAAALESLRDEPDDLVLRREEAAMVDRIADLIDNAVTKVVREARQDFAEGDIAPSPPARSTSRPK